MRTEDNGIINSESGEVSTIDHLCCLDRLFIKKQIWMIALEKEL